MSDISMEEAQALHDLILCRIRLANFGAVEYLVSDKLVSDVTGVRVNFEELLAMGCVLDSKMEGIMRGCFAGLLYLENVEAALIRADFEEVLRLQSGIMTDMLADPICAAMVWGYSIVNAAMGKVSAFSMISESGSCPTGHHNCRLSGFSDVTYFLAKELGDLHGFEVPDLGVKERRFSTRAEVVAYIEMSSLEMILSLVSESQPSVQNDEPVFGGGAWGNLPIPEA